MTAMPGPNINLVLVDRAAGLPVVAATSEHRADTHGNHHSFWTHHVPVVRQCGTNGTTDLCPQEKTQAQQLPLGCPTGCLRTICHYRHGKHQQHEGEAQVTSPKTTLLWSQAQTQEGQTRTPTHNNKYDYNVVQ